MIGRRTIVIVGAALLAVAGIAVARQAYEPVSPPISESTSSSRLTYDQLVELDRLISDYWDSTDGLRRSLFFETGTLCRLSHRPSDEAAFVELRREISRLELSLREDALAFRQNVDQMAPGHACGWTGMTCNSEPNWTGSPCKYSENAATLPNGQF
jgi:hypothetical protein